MNKYLLPLLIATVWIVFGRFWFNMSSRTIQSSTTRRRCVIYIFQFNFYKNAGLSLRFGSFSPVDHTDGLEREMIILRWSCCSFISASYRMFPLWFKIEDGHCLDMISCWDFKGLKLCILAQLNPSTWASEKQVFGFCATCWMSARCPEGFSVSLKFNPPFFHIAYPYMINPYVWWQTLKVLF